MCVHMCTMVVCSTVPHIHVIIPSTHAMRVLKIVRIGSSNLERPRPRHATHHHPSHQPIIYIPVIHHHHQHHSALMETWYNSCHSSASQNINIPLPAKTTAKTYYFNKSNRPPRFRDDPPAAAAPITKIDQQRNTPPQTTHKKDRFQPNRLARACQRSLRSSFTFLKLNKQPSLP